MSSRPAIFDTEAKATIFFCSRAVLEVKDFSGILSLNKTTSFHILIKTKQLLTLIYYYASSLLQYYLYLFGVNHHLYNITCNQHRNKENL